MGTIVNHIGEVWTDRNNEKVTIIDRKPDSDDKLTNMYIVRWENGQELATTYHNITHGLFSKRKATKIGLKSKTKDGKTIKIIGYRNSHDIDVQFEDGVIVENKCLSDFYNGYIRYPQKHKWIGKKSVNKDGRQMEIIDYINNKKVIVQFEDGEQKKCGLQAFTDGTLVHPKDAEKRHRIAYENRLRHETAKINAAKNKETQEYKFRQELKKKCEDNNINYDTARDYHNKHKDLSVNDIIEYYNTYHKNNNYHGKSIRQACKELGLCASSIYGIHNEHPEQSYEEIIDRLINKKQSISELCNIHNISVQAFYKYKEAHPELSVEQIIDYYTTREISLRELCKQNNIDYKTCCYYKSKHPEFNNDELIDFCIQNMIGRVKSENIGEVIKPTGKLKEKCIRLGLDYTKVKQYRYMNKTTDEIAIIHFRPDLYINIFGELVNINN